MTTSKKLPLRLIIGLVVAIGLDTGLQFFWKVAATDLPDANSSWFEFIQALPVNPLFLFVIFLMGLQFFNWLVVLTHADLSYAHPVTALSYVSVFMLSIVYLDQKTDLIQVLGIAFVLAGVWFISRTEHKTPSKDMEVR